MALLTAKKNNYIVGDLFMTLVFLVVFVFSAIAFVPLYRVVSPTPNNKNTKIILLMCIPPFTVFGFILTLLLIFRDIFLYRVYLERGEHPDTES